MIIFTYNYPFGTGETFLHNELHWLSGSFSRIHIFPLFYGNCKTPREVPLNVTFSTPFICFDLKKDKLKLLIAGIFNSSPVWFSLTEGWQKRVFLKKVWFKKWLTTTLITRILLRKNNCSTIADKIFPQTVIYFYWGDKSSGIVPFLKEKYPNPVIARFHNSDLYEEINGGYIAFRQSLLKYLDHAVFISGKGKEYLINHYPGLTYKPEVFRLGVEAHFFREGSTDDVLRIVSCSNMVPIKRVDLILESVLLLHFNVQWTHFGGGPLLEEIRSKSGRLAGNIQIELRGHTGNEDILNFYARNPVDLFINVSESEGIPVSIMEAISFGIPVLATDVGGTSEIVNDRTGILVPRDITPAQIAQLITEYYNSERAFKAEKRKEAFDLWRSTFNAEVNFTAFAGFVKSLCR